MGKYLMVNLIKLDIRHNKTILFFMILLNIMFVLLLILGIYNINIYNFNINDGGLSNYNTNIIKWVEFLYPFIFASFIAKIYSDAFASTNIDFTLTIPIEIYKQIFIRLSIWIVFFTIIIFVPINIFQDTITETVGSKYLPIQGLLFYTISNMFILSCYVIFLQIIFKEFYFSIGFLIIYSVMDYYAEGRFLKDFSLHSYAYKNYELNFFILQKTALIIFGIFLLIVSYLLLTKSNRYRKEI